jgi:thiol-disulfide isomerase/thioredoxin
MVARTTSRRGRRSTGAPATGRGGQQGAGGLDARWLIGGATLVVVLAAVLITYFAGGFGGGGGGGGGSVPVGQVTETALNGPAAPGMLAVGTPAPDLQWTLSGEPGSVAGQRGHPVLLAFVATWCPHCQAEVAVLNKIQDRFAGQGLKLYAVTASPQGMDGRSRASLGDLELFVKQFNARYPHLFDGSLVGAQRYGVRGFPTLYVLDSGGTIRFAQSGEVPEADLAAAVQSVMAAG